MDIIGNRIQELRKKNGLTQAQLSKLCNTTRGVISTYEIGANNPPIPMLITLANIFHTSVEYLIGLNDNPNIENTDIGHLTGLSDNALALLAKLKQSNTDDNNHILHAINLLLDINKYEENTNFFRNIYAFLYTDITTTNGFGNWELDNSPDLPDSKDLHIIIPKDKLIYALLLNNNAYLDRLKEKLNAPERR